MNKTELFLSKIGLADVVADITDDTTAEQIQGKVDQWNEVQDNYFKSIHTSKLKKLGGDEAIEGYKLNVRKQFNKLLGMGKTSKELSSLDHDDFVESAKAFHTSKLDALHEGLDDSVKKELNSWKSQAKDLKVRYDDLESDMEAQLELKENEGLAKLSEYQVKLMFKDKFANVKQDSIAFPERWGRDVLMIQAEISESFNVNPDGTILNKDKTPARAFEGKSIWQSVDDAVGFIMERDGLVRKSNAGQKPFSFTKPGGNEELSENAKEMQSRFVQARANAN